MQALAVMALMLRIRAGEQLIAYVLREIRRQSRSGPRAALHALVMPTGELNLSIALNLSRPSA
jgi:hypothetical protein